MFQSGPNTKTVLKDEASKVLDDNIIALTQFRAFTVSLKLCNI